ncbi:MAG: lipopolysaccharide kinase InaA family protein [Planctomycetota bacterium]|jgi:hypothetical protein
MVQELAGGRRLFRKIRSSAPARAMAEWRNLFELEGLGFVLPRPLLLARRGRATAVCFLDVPGRPLDVLLAECEQPQASLPFLGEVMVRCRSLHRQGYCYRDLYWAHLFAEHLDDPTAVPALIDVERAFKPRWRRRRWWIKDLASLLASWPAARQPRVLMLRLLRAYLAEDFHGRWKDFARPVLRRAKKIRAHRPRYGDMGFRS